MQNDNEKCQMQENLLLQYLGILTISKWLRNKRIRQNKVIHKKAKQLRVENNNKKKCIWGIYIMTRRNDAEKTEEGYNYNIQIYVYYEYICATKVYRNVEHL